MLIKPSDIDPHLAGLTEAKVSNGMPSSTSDFILATQILAIQNGTANDTLWGDEGDNTLCGGDGNDGLPS